MFNLLLIYYKPSTVKINILMVKNNNKANPDKKMFFDTIKDMRKLIQKNTNSYTASTLGLTKKNTKVPYDHLIGRRNSIKQQFKT